VARARKIQRFCSQPFHVAEQFTGTRQVRPIKETVRGFKEILEGNTTTFLRRFYLVGTIDEAVEKAKK